MLGNPTCRGLVAAAALIVCAAPAGAQETDLADNAALVYWPALSLLPQVDSAGWKVLNDLEHAKLDADARKLIDSADRSLRYARRAARMRRADWGLNYDEGVYLLLPHLDKGRTLSRFLLLRALDEVERGEPHEALEDTLAGIATGRHLAADGTFIGYLVQMAIEEQSVNLLAGFLPSLSAEDRKALAARLDRLPPGGSLERALATERRTGSGWLVKRLEAMRGDRPEVWKGEVVELLAPTSAHFTDVARQRVRKMLDDLGDDTPATLLKHARDLARTHEQLAKLTTASPEDAARKIRDTIEAARRDNPLAKDFLIGPGTGRAWERSAAMRARLLMLKAALAVLAGKPEDVEGHPDPYGKGAFGYRKLRAGGFQITSRLTVGGKPLTLSVGRPRP